MTESVTADPLLAVLTELALDLCWCWNHATDELWRRLDPELWQLSHNPWVVLQTVSRQTTRDAFADPIFRKKANQMLSENAWWKVGQRGFRRRIPERLSPASHTSAWNSC